MAKTLQKQKEVLTLGRYDEIRPISFENMDKDVEWITEALHKIMFKEFLSRTALSAWCWSRRVENVFKANHIDTVRDIIYVSLTNVNRLSRCGFKTRREVYDTFLKEYNIKLNQWNPEHHWDKYTSVPQDEE
jgi:hypothetical protein